MSTGGRFVVTASSHLSLGYFAKYLRTHLDKNDQKGADKTLLLLRVFALVIG